MALYKLSILSFSNNSRCLWLISEIPLATKNNPDLKDYPKNVTGTFIEVRIEVMNGTKDLIGKQGPHDNYFRGTLNEFRIWNVVRTATEISNNMNTELTGNESGLVL